MISAQAAKRYSRMAVAGLIALIVVSLILSALALASIWYLLAAEILWLTPIIGAAGANAAAGATALALICLCIWLIWPSADMKAKAESAKPGLAAEEKLRNIVREHPLETVSSAFAVGVAAGIDPDTRALLIKILISLVNRSDEK